MSDTERRGEEGHHDRCPAEWCIVIACADCGEMLTNPKPSIVGLEGICSHHGRKARAVLLRRDDCLVRPGEDAHKAVEFGGQFADEVKP